MLPAQHRQRKSAELPPTGLDAKAGDAVDQTGVIEPADKKPWQTAKSRQLLLQVDVNAAENDSRLADIDLIGTD